MVQLWFFFDSRFICDPHLLSIHLAHIYSSLFIITFLFHYYFILSVAVQFSCVLICLMTIRVLKGAFKKINLLLLLDTMYPLPMQSVPLTTQLQVHNGRKKAMSWEPPSALWHLQSAAEELQRLLLQLHTHSGG